jgi:hypothetical protein
VVHQWSILVEEFNGDKTDVLVLGVASTVHELKSGIPHNEQVGGWVYCHAGEVWYAGEEFDSGFLSRI